MNTTISSTSSGTNASNMNGASSGSGSGTASNPERKRLYITHVDSFGPYLKIAGLLNPDAMGIVRSQIQKQLATCYAIDQSWPVARQQALLLPGAMCLYKRINGAAPADFEFVRTRIVKVIASNSPQTPLRVEIEIIDYGYNCTVLGYEVSALVRVLAKFRFLIEFTRYLQLMKA